MRSTSTGPSVEENTSRREHMAIGNVALRATGSSIVYTAHTLLTFMCPSDHTSSAYACIDIISIYVHIV